MFVLLLTILISPLLSQPAPYSYVATEYFGAYQAIFTPGSGTVIANASLSYPIIFKEVRVNASTLSAFPTFGGLERNPTTPASVVQSGFRVLVGSVISTLAMLTLTVNGASEFKSLTFLVLIVHGTPNNGFFEAAFFQRNQTITSVAPIGAATAVKSYPLLPLSQTTTVAGFSHKIYLSYFSLKQTNNGKDFSLGIENLTIATSSVNFTYYVDQGTEISQIGLVIIFYKPLGTSYTTPTEIFVLNQTYGGYTSNLNFAVTNVSQGYVNGFQDKCLIGHSNFTFNQNYQLTFDLKSSTNYTCNGCNGGLTMHTLCLIKNISCRTIHLNCTGCNSYSNCTACDPTYFPVNSNFPTKCQLCSVAITGCELCNNATVCLNCTYPTYVMDTTNICQPCNVYKPYCLNCNRTSPNPVKVTCLVCMNYYGLISGNCSLCSTMMPGCQLCTTSSSCTKCLNGYYLNTSGVCVICSTAINNCAICDNSTYCTLCNSDSYLSNNNSVCTCNPGLYPISGYCSVAGCSSAIRFTSSTSCLACSTSTSFYLAGNNCNCMVGYTLGGNSCNVTCGDSRVISPEGCDDGNIISGDGCSSSCQVQTNYNCVNGSFYNASICVYVGPITVTLANIVKSSGLNEATLTFTLSPATLALNSMEFSQYVNLTVGSAMITKKISYDQAGTLSIVVGYSTNLEGLPTQMNLTYDPQKVALPKTTLKFNMVGSNLPVIIADISGHQNIVYALGYVLVGIYLFCLILSTIFHKMIGLQTMQILQIIFFVRYLLTNSNPLVFFNINSIKYINGYNFFSQYSNIRMLDGNLLRMGLGKTFVFNVMVQIAIIIIMALLSYWFSRKIRHLKGGKANQTSIGMDELKKAQLYERKFSNAGFIFTVYSFYIVIFSTLSSLQSQEQLSLSLPRLLFIVTMFVLIYGILFMTGLMYLSWKPKYDENEGLSNKYISIFLGYHILISLLIIAMPGVPYGKCIIAGFQFIYIIILICIKPYFLTVQNVLLIICEIIGLLFSVWLIVSEFIFISNSTLHKIMIAYESLLALVGIIATVRMYLHFKDNDRAFKLKHQEEDRMKAKDSFSKTEFQKQQVMLANQKLKPTLTQKKKIEETEQIQELQRIKNRLKGQHRLKLMQETIL